MFSIVVVPIFIVSERQIPYDIIYMWSLRYGTNDSIYRTKTDHGYGGQTCICPGEGERKGQMGSLGLVDANYYI